MYSNLHIHTIAPKALTHQSHSFSISVWSVFTGSVIRSPAKSKSNHDDDDEKKKPEPNEHILRGTLQNIPNALIDFSQHVLGYGH